MPSPLSAIERLNMRLFTVGSLVVHTVAFGAWIATRGFGADNEGFTIGTGLLSLEAIFITLLVGIAVARQSVAQAEHYDEVAQAHTRMLKENEAGMARIEDLLDTVSDLMEAREP